MPDAKQTPTPTNTEMPDRGVEAADQTIEQTGSESIETSDTKPDYVDRAADAGREGGSR